MSAGQAESAVREWDQLWSAYIHARQLGDPELEACARRALDSFERQRRASCRTAVMLCLLAGDQTTARLSVRVRKPAPSVAGALRRLEVAKLVELLTGPRPRTWTLTPAGYARALELDEQARGEACEAFGLAGAL